MASAAKPVPITPTHLVFLYLPRSAYHFGSYCRMLYGLSVDSSYFKPVVSDSVYSFPCLQV